MKSEQISFVVYYGWCVRSPLARLIHETGWILARGLRGVEKGVKNQEEPRSGSVRDVLALKNVAKGLPVLIFLVKRAEVSLGLPLHSKK